MVIICYGDQLHKQPCHSLNKPHLVHVTLETWSLHYVEDDMNMEVSCAACTEFSKTAMKLHYQCRIGN